MKDYTHLLELVVSLVFCLLTMFVIPWIRQKITLDKLNVIMKWVKIAVQAAEMIYKESGLGKYKKQFVEEFLSTHLGISFDESQIDSLIESAVLELKNEVKDIDNNV